MARPTKRTPEVVARVLALVARDDRPLSLAGACGVCDLDPDSFRAWTKSDPELARALRVARAKGLAVLEGRALDPDVSGPAGNVLRHRLGCMDADEWGERRVEVDGGALTLTDLAKADAVETE